jgi:hypothetical protein
VVSIFKGRKINKMVNRVNNVVTNIGNIVSLPKRKNKGLEGRKKRDELRIRT